MSVPIFGISDLEFHSQLEKIHRAIIPVGSLEQHGQHLPVSTDSLIVEAIARLVAENVPSFVLPVIPYGVSFEHMPMFNVSLSDDTLSSVICDACASLAGNGIKSTIIINGHHGNAGALQYIAQRLHGRLPADASVHTINYWHMLKSEFDHAGEVETSLVLALAPELVHMDRAEPNSKKLPKSKAAYGTMTNVPGSFPRITGNGVWGNPQTASAEKGSRMLEEIVAGLSNTILELE